MDDRVALVTGSSRGIGRGIALELADRGNRVAVNYRQDEDGANETVKQIEDLGGTAEPYRADVGDRDQVNQMISRVGDRFGRLDIVVSNALYAIPSTVMDISEEDWLRGMKVNCSALLYLAQAAVPVMRQNGQGWFVATTSHGSEYALDDYVSIGVSKAALETLVKYMAKELGPDGIRCNLVSPGAVKTQAASDVYPDIDVDDLMDLVEQTVPAGRQPTPREIGKVVAFLCSPEADLITGQKIEHDGGWSLLQPGMGAA